RRLGPASPQSRSNDWRSARAQPPVTNFWKGDLLLPSPHPLLRWVEGPHIMFDTANNSINLPETSFQAEIEHGGIKKIKSENRRSDAMSFVPPEKLKALPGFNVRVRDDAYEAHIRQLADSMKEPTGFRLDKPIHCFVRKESDGSDTICIIDGHSRHEAVLLAISEGAQ